MTDKVVKKKYNKLYGKWKGCDNYFYSWIDGKISLYKSYFPEPYIQSKNKIKVKVYWSNYAIKSDLKSVASIDTSHLLNKVI